MLGNQNSANQVIAKMIVATIVYLISNSNPLAQTLETYSLTKPEAKYAPYDGISLFDIK